MTNINEIKTKKLATRHDISNISRPRFMLKTTLQTKEAQQVMERRLRQVATALFNLDVVLRIIANRDEVGAVEEIIIEDISKVKSDLETERQRLLETLSENGIEDLVTYSNPITYQYEKDSQRIADFGELITMVDEVVPYIDTLWLNSVISTNHRTDAVYMWSRRLMKLANRIISLQNRAIKSARKAGHDGTLKDQIKKVDGEEEVLAEEAKETEAEAETAQSNVVTL